MAWQVQALSMQVWQPEFKPQNPCTVERRDLTLQPSSGFHMAHHNVCPLTYTYNAHMVRVYTGAHAHTQTDDQEREEAWILVD